MWPRCGPAGTRWRSAMTSPTGQFTPTCSASRSCCGGARTESRAPTRTCACTGGRPCRSAGSPATSSSAPTTAGVTGPTAAPYRWRCDAARQVENFTDFGHFPWVHPGLLGDPERPVVPRHEVRTEGNVLHYSIVRPEPPNPDDFPVFGNEQAGPPERRSRYELHLPYTIVLRLGWGGERGMVY